MSPRRTISASTIAGRLHVQARTVIGWIRDGELASVDVRASKARRATHRVTLASFEAFLRRRGATDDSVRDLLST